MVNGKRNKIDETNRSNPEQHERAAAHEELTHEQIAARAYECWQERGGVQGSPEMDWHRAEKELKGNKSGRAERPKAAAAAAG